MQYTQFNKKEFNKLIELNKIDPYLALEKMEAYISEYPTHYNAYPFYASSYITLNRLEEARKVLDFIKELKYDSFFRKKENLVEILNVGIVFVTIKLLVAEKKYEECLKVCKENKELLRKAHKEVQGVILYCRKQLRDNININFSEDQYLYNQIINYSNDRLLEHLKKHDADSDIDEKSIVMFSPEFKLEKIVEEIKTIVPKKENKYFTGMIDDKYFFKYDNCGRVANKLTDYFAVITLPDSNDIITIYPSMYGEKFNYIDLNYLKENDKPKEKRLSRIDKFNQKYGIK